MIEFKYMESLFHVLKPRRIFVVITAVVVALLAVALSFTQPLKYSASIRLQITQRAAFTLDPYTAIRSTELIGENLAQLIGTSSFLDRVLQTGYKIDQRYFALTETRRRKLWAKTAEAQQVRGKGFLDVSVFHPNREEALKIVAAISFLVSTQGSDYVGRDIVVRLVDAPLASRFPVRPNIPANALTGALFGTVLGSGWVWVEHRRQRHHGHLV